MQTITQASIAQLTATGHAVAIYPRKGLVVVDGFKRFAYKRPICPTCNGCRYLGDGPDDRRACPECRGSGLETLPTEINSALDRRLAELKGGQS